jgi:type I restriction enzyme, R subunit
MTPEARARQHIDAMLTRAGWLVQDRRDVNLTAGPGVAVREVPTPTGPADYILFLDARACGALEAQS